MSETNSIPGSVGTPAPLGMIHIIAPYHHHEVNNLPLFCGIRERDLPSPENIWAEGEPLSEVIVTRDEPLGDFTIMDVIEQICPECIMALIERQKEVTKRGKILGQGPKGGPR